MTKDKNLIIDEIMKHMSVSGHQYSNWYVGITSDPRKRLFEEHNVSETLSRWIYRKAQSNIDARDIEKYFVETLKTDGGSGGGDNLSSFVYAYLKTPYTLE